MNTASEKRLSQVHPELQKQVSRIVVALAATGQTIEVVQGLRTYAEQDALYAQGRLRAGPKVTNARGGFSNHNFALAVDLCPFVNGKPQWNDTKTFNRIGALAESFNLRWGGSWKHLADLPHVELVGPSLVDCRALFKKGGLQAVWAKVK